MSSLKRKAGAQVGTDAKKPKQNGNIMSFFGAPGVKAAANGSSTGSGGAAAAAAQPALPKFDKQKWVAGLTAEQRELLSLEINTLHVSWLALLKDEIVSKEFLELKRFLSRETAAGKKWFPPKEDVYSWYVSRMPPLPLGLDRRQASLCPSCLLGLRDWQSHLRDPDRPIYPHFKKHSS